jgi:hypothetical protein
MTRSTRLRASALISCAALMLALGGTGQAQAAESPDQARATAGQAVINGTATAAQKNLVASDPDLAATIPVTFEESAPETDRDPVDSSAPVAGRPAAACPAGTKYIVTTSKTVTAKSTLGFTTFKYHHKVKYCESGTKFLKFLSRSQWFTDEDWVVNVGELVDNPSSISNGRGYTKVKRKVIITNFMGDDWVIYPWIKGNFKPGDINWSGNADNQI